MALPMGVSPQQQQGLEPGLAPPGGKEGGLTTQPRGNGWPTDQDGSWSQWRWSLGAHVWWESESGGKGPFMLSAMASPSALGSRAGRGLQSSEGH